DVPVPTVVWVVPGPFAFASTVNVPELVMFATSAPPWTVVTVGVPVTVTVVGALRTMPCAFATAFNCDVALGWTEALAVALTFIVPELVMLARVTPPIAGPVPLPT